MNIENANKKRDHRLTMIGMWRWAIGALLLLPTLVSAALFSAILPASRSAMVDNTVTAFATLINASAGQATGCGIGLATAVAATLSYQTTDPATNRATGDPNTLVNVAPGASQSFVIAVTPTGAFGATDIAFSFDCANAEPAPSLVGLNTLLLSSSRTPVPDVVALGATTSGDGVVGLDRLSGAGAFAVASVNLGASDQIRVSADTGGAALPLTLALCETDPAAGNCVSAIGPEVTTTIAAGATPTFGIFVTSNEPIDFDPAGKRIFVRFRGTDGEVRGATSVAVRTLTTDLQFPGGGGLVFPEGALPEGATIATGTGAMPLLPDGVTGLGQVVEVSASADPLRPIEVRLPMPAGENPDDLAILRIEDDGTTTVLGTSVDGAELVAGTPGFSRLLVGRHPRIRVAIAGPALVEFGSRDRYSLARHVFEDIGWVPPNWSIPVGPSSIETTQGTLAYLIAGQSAGTATLMADYVDRTIGLDGFASRNIVVANPMDVPDREQLTLYFNTTTLIIGQEPALEVRAYLLAHPQIPSDDPVEFTWDFGDGSTNSLIRTTGSTTSFELPPHTYTEAGTHRVDVVATHLASGRSGQSQFDVTVLDSNHFAVYITGLEHWLAAPGEKTFTAQTVGGAPGFNYRWRVTPGTDWVVGDREHSITFHQPGSFLVEVEAEDSSGRSVGDHRYVTVRGAEALQATLDVQDDGADVDASVRVRGGLLVTNGKTDGYRTLVDWGDGVTTVVNTPLPDLPNEGVRSIQYGYACADPAASASETTGETSHSYSNPGEYTIKVTVSDVTGKQVKITETVQVEETEEPGEPEIGVPTAAVCPRSILDGMNPFASFEIRENTSFAMCYYEGEHRLTIRYSYGAGKCEHEGPETAVWLSERHITLFSTQRTVEVLVGVAPYFVGRDETMLEILEAAVAQGVGRPCP